MEALKVLNILTGKPPRWSFFFSKVAGLESIPAISLKKDSTT